MKALEFIVKSIFTIILVLVAEISWAQFAPSLTSGSGIKEDPYLIASINDWNAFANDVIGGYSYVGEFVKLTSDIGTAETPVTTMVGNLVNTVYYSCCINNYNRYFHRNCIEENMSTFIFGVKRWQKIDA